MRWLAAFLCLMGSQVAEASGLKLTILNPSRVEAMAYRVEEGGRLEPLGVLHARGQLHVQAYRGQVFEVSWGCRRKVARFKVKDTLEATWKLPARPCG